MVAEIVVMVFGERSNLALVNLLVSITLPLPKLNPLIVNVPIPLITAFADKDEICGLTLAAMYVN